jgi:tetratricopeptide (TPR) repeat protein
VTPAHHWQAVREALAEGRTDVAAAAADGVLGSATTDPEELTAAAFVMLTSHACAEAAELATRAIREDFGCVPAYVVLGSAYDRLGGAYDRSLLVWSELIELAPKLGVARVLHGESLRAAGLPGEARGEWKRAVPLPGGERARWDLALLELAQEGLVAGLAALRGAASPDRAEDRLFVRALAESGPLASGVEKGSRKITNGDALAATEAARRELDQRPDDVGALALAGQALLQCGSDSEALAASLRALTLKPGYAPALVVAGSAFTRRPGLAGHAVATFEGLVRALPSASTAHVLLAEALLSAGRYPEALTAAARAVAADPGDARARSVLAFALLVADRHVEAWWHVSRGADHELVAGGVIWDLLEQRQVAS